MESGFEEIEHTADIAIRVWGTDLRELFHSAALGLAAQLADPHAVTTETSVSVELEADDVETLLVEWLSELLYLSERENVVFIEFDIPELTANRLRATARGGTVDRFDHHIKAVTFSEINVERVENQYRTTVVFDV